MSRFPRAWLALPCLAVCACSAPTSSVEPAEGMAACASCHADYVDELSRSAHGGSGDSPVLTALLPEVERAWGVGARLRCEHCHTRAEAADGVVSCALCHRAVGNRGGDGSIVIDPSLPIAATRPDAASPHPLRQTGLLRDAQLCGSCHELTGPELFVEPTLSEHLASPMARGGVTCADCHLPEREANGSGEANHRHDFVGFDPPWGAPADEGSRAAADSLALLRAGLDLRVRRDGDELVLELENVGASHHIPTGATWLREIWVDVRLVRASGVQEARVLSLGAEPMHEGQPVVLITDADEVVEHSLGSGEVRSHRFDARDLESASFTLKARAARPEILRALGLESRLPEVPTHEAANLSYEAAR